MPVTKKYEYLLFPETDVWGLIMPEGDPLAKKEELIVDDLIGIPLFTSRQGWERDIARWCGERISDLRMEGTFRLPYNASMFVKEGLGYQLTFAHLVDVSHENGLVFRPLSPKLETKLYLIWNKYQTFTPIAERFIEQVKKSFSQLHLPPLPL